jgi:multiple sugar transport system ATP-binding protein
MANLSIKNIRKTYPNGVEVLKGINLEINDGEFLILVGGSGCGKSTLLNMIAGLETVTEGEIQIGGKRVNDLPPKDRDIAMVFQSYALYPSMSVRDNIAFGLSLRKVPKAEQEATIARVAKLLQIEALLDRRPAQLSGGQRQRVAMGRALAREPQLFLFDEPLSNLDAKLRVEMRSEIKLLHKRLGITTVYVTHDQIEAMTLGDKIAVMKDGVVQQFGTPDDIYKNPVNTFVASFMGSPPMNLIPGRLRRDGDALALEVTVGDADAIRVERVRLPRAIADLDAWVDRDVLLGLRPEHISDRGRRADAPVIQVPITMVESTGADALLFTRLGGNNVVCRVDPSALSSAEQSESHIGLALDLASAVLFDPKTEQRIDGEST